MEFSALAFTARNRTHGCSATDCALDPSNSSAEWSQLVRPARISRLVRNSFLSYFVNAITPENKVRRSGSPSSRSSSPEPKELRLDTDYTYNAGYVAVPLFRSTS